MSENIPRQIILELKLGINPKVSDLITGDIQAHWLPDEKNILRSTGFRGTITGDYWNPDTDILRIQDAGTSSEYWTLDGSNILRIYT
jgi:hypothetical protein